MSVLLISSTTIHIVGEESANNRARPNFIINRRPRGASKFQAQIRQRESWLSVHALSNPVIKRREAAAPKLQRHHRCGIQTRSEFAGFFMRVSERGKVGRDAFSKCAHVAQIIINRCKYERMDGRGKK